MTTDLRRALHDLADRQPPTGPPPDLWTRGVRRSRRRRAGSVAVVAAAAVVLGALLAGLPGGRTAPQPADVPASALRAPDRVFVPSPWAPGTDELGPPGPLAVLAEVEHRRTSWFGTGMAYFGISAVDGGYRYLDLPDADLSTPPQLSPDGRAVGYALRGDLPPTAHSHVTGFAVYDTATGRVTRWPVRTRYGLAVDIDSLAWSPDSGYLVAHFGQNMADPSTSNRYRTLGFPRRTGAPVRLARGAQPDGFGTGVDGAVTWSDLGRVFYSQRPGAAAPTSHRVDLGVGGGPVLSPDGSRFVAIAQGPTGQPGTSTNRFYVGSTPRPGETAATRLLARRWQAEQVLGWTDDRRVLVRAHPGAGIGYRVVVLDTATGSVTPAVRVQDEPDHWLTPQFAADLLRRPLVAGVRPPAHRDPRVVPAGAATAVLLGGLVLLLRRRRAVR